MDGSGESRSSAARNSPDPLDGRIADVAFGQHGVVAGWQLVELGLSANAARKRVAAGRLHRVHRGVFAMGHARLTQHGRFMAAVLASGRVAAASHYCSGVLWHLGLGVRRLIDVTTTSGACGRTLAGIRVHRSTTLLPRDVTVRDHIPCTSLARTLLDIAQTATRRDVERACDRADHSRELDMNAIDDVLDRASGRRGATLLRAVLAGHRVGSTLTRNDLEEAFLAICRAIGCPPDGANVWIPFPDGGGAEADFLYRDRTLIAEVDGRDPHTTRKAFTADRRRDQRLMLLGWRVVRFTWQQVTFEPADVAATLRGLLGDS